jgi:1,2-phenylacetyl-CoA epoxidase catalytic subunit
MITKDDSQHYLVAELLCAADTNWVLGHWFLKVIMNGRSLTDCTAFAGMAQDTLGHTRALFQILEDWNDMPDQQLEFGRGIEKIHSMQVLDKPPSNWGDFVVTSLLVGDATWRFLCTFKSGTNKSLEGMVEHIGSESYFHRMNITGWLKELTNEERQDLELALPARLSMILAWFGSQEYSTSDPLLAAGVRSASLWEARHSFVEEVNNKLVTMLGINESLISNILTAPVRTNCDNSRRRTEGSNMPAELWEFLVPTCPEAVAARRSIDVSITDNIDLFV